MGVSITQIKTTDIMTSGRITINNNFQNISTYITNLESVINWSSASATFSTVSVGASGMSILPASGNNAITISNSTTTNVLTINSKGLYSSKSFVQAYGTWSTTDPTSYNIFSGISRYGSVGNTFVSTDAAGRTYLMELLYPSQTNSLEVVMGSLNQNLTPYKNPANGGTLSQVVRTGNVEFHSRVILSNKGGKVGTSTFTTFTATVALGSVSISTPPEQLKPNVYGTVCEVEFSAANNAFYIDTSALEDGEIFWVIGRAGGNGFAGHLVTKLPSAATSYFAAGEITPTGTVAGTGEYVNFGPNSKLLLMNRRAGATADRLIVLVNNL